MPIKNVFKMLLPSEIFDTVFFLGGRVVLKIYLRKKNISWPLNLHIMASYISNIVFIEYIILRKFFL